MEWHAFPTPIGVMRVHSDGGSVTALDWGGGVVADAGPATCPVLQDARHQIEAYFDGKLTRFDVPLHVEGSGFQRQVCEAMRRIPFGETQTYGDLARICGAPAQAIGGACGGNPIPLIIPCHRVLGASGLGGFSGRGGVETKVWLLRFEGAAGLLI